MPRAVFDLPLAAFLVFALASCVWSVDPERDTLEELLVRMREFGASVLEPKGITYRFDAQGDHTAALPPSCSPIRGMPCTSERGSPRFTV